MRIPDRLYVGPYTYWIERPDLIDEKDGHVVGRINHLNQVISIRNGVSRDHAEEAFFHEMLHAVETFMELNLDEKEVTLLARGLWMVLKQNGLLKEDENA